MTPCTLTTGTAARVVNARADVFQHFANDRADQARFIGRPFAGPFKIMSFHLIGVADARR
jgi:hypothetical protein